MTLYSTHLLLHHGPRRLFVLTGLLIALCLSVAWFVPGRVAGADAMTPAVPSPNSSLMFIKNVGQFADDARFQVRGSDRTIWLAEDAIWVTILEPAGPTTRRDHEHEANPFTVATAADIPRRGVNLRLSFVGANPTPQIQPSDPVSTTISYFYGNDPTGWRPDVPVWGNVRYEDLYPGLDLELVGQGGALVPQLVCHATDCAASLAAVQIEVAGAEEVTLAEEGVLIGTAVGEWHLPLLAVVDGAGRPVDVGRTTAAVVGSQVVRPFKTGVSQPLYATSSAPDANPAGSDLLYGTYLGGTDWERGYAIALDPAGHAAVTGYTLSLDFPVTPGAFDIEHGVNWDAFVAQFNPTGSALVYATFLGGDGHDRGAAIVADEAGNVTVTGRTRATNFPVTPGAYDTTYNGGESNGDAFITRLNPSGSELLYSTFLGGSVDDFGLVINLDGAGNAYVAGHTTSLDFPVTADAFDTTYNDSGSQGDAFVARLDSTGSELLYATYLGGGDGDSGSAIALDDAGNLTVAGFTDSDNFPTTPGAFDTNYEHGNADDVFVVQLNADGSALNYGTYLGGWHHDHPSGLVLDSAGNAIILGHTHSDNFPTTPDAYDTSFDGSGDAFIAQLNPDGSTLVYSTYLGGGGDDGVGGGLVLDASGSLIITGSALAGFPTTPGAFDTAYNGYNDSFIARFSVNDSELLYSSYLGGSMGDDEAHGIAIATTSKVVIVGYTNSPDFPTTPGAFDTSYNGQGDLFITQWVVDDSIAAQFTAGPVNGAAPLAVEFTNLSSGDFADSLWDFGDGITSTLTNPVHEYLSPGTYTVILTVSGAGGTDTVAVPNFITVYVPVTAHFTASPVAGVVPLAVGFSNLSSGNYETCLWDFGDGDTSSECDNPSHTYMTAGSYTVVFTVSGLGGTDTLIEEELITVEEPVTADFTAQPTSGIAPLGVSFTNLSSGSYDTCLWEFGDGSMSSECSNLNHTYTASGSYTVTLTISGSNGTDSLIRPGYLAVYQAGEPPVAGFLAEPTSGTVPLVVEFTNLSTGDYSTCLWDFGDGNTSSQCNNPLHTYTTPGTYTVTLTIIGPGGEDVFVEVDYITSIAPNLLFLPVMLGGG